LLPPAWRRPAAVAVLVCVAVTALLGLRFTGQAHPGRLDSAVDGWARGAATGHAGPLRLLEGLGNPVPATVMTAALVLACLLTRRWRGAVLAGVAVPAAAGLTEGVLKPLAGRTMEGWLSFPSGHATGMFSLAVTCAVLLAGPPARRIPAALRLSLVAGAAAAAAAVALAMVGLGLHYFTDTIAGAAVGTAVVLLAALALDRCPPGTRRQPVPVTVPRDDPAPELSPGGASRGA